MKRLRPLILTSLEQHQIKAGTANGLKAEVRAQERTELDEDLLPPPIKKAATRRKTVEILKVTRAGDPNNGNGTPEQEDGPEELACTHA